MIKGDKKYDHKKIEPKWQKAWEEGRLYHASDTSKKPKFFQLVEFPYPSGAGLHVGHVRSWTGMDAYSRKKRMQGFNVLYPIGWDAFGLPAENYAIKMGVHPSITTSQNIENFKRQIKSLGISFDWSREINTTDPDYYKWTQWIFLKLLDKGLAYQAETYVNWCPFCKTNLADEEVLSDGNHERCGNPTEKRLQKQWLLRITKYADRLINDLENIDFSPAIRDQQVNWIGKKTGAEIIFAVSKSDIQIKVFTTRPDTLFGATFIVVSPEYAKKYLVNLIDEPNKKNVLAYIDKSLQNSSEDRVKTDKEKTGINTDLYAINPANGSKLPIFVTDYILSDYGTGAVMGVPAHDERDYAFARKHNLSIIKVINIDSELHSIVIKKSVSQDFIDLVNKSGWYSKEYEGWGYMVVVPAKDAKSYALLVQKCLKEGPWYVYTDGVDNQVIFKNKIFDALKDSKEAKNYATQLHIPFKQQDWDKPGNFMYCWNVSGKLVNSGDWDDMEVPANLGKIVSKIEETGWGKAMTTYHLRDWIFSRQHYWGEPIPVVHCSKCGVVPVDEKDLPVKLPYLDKYQPSGTGESPLANVADWIKVDCPKCGQIGRRETDTMPNWAGSNWYYIRYTDPQNNSEIASKKSMGYWLPVDFYQGGIEHITLHLLYSRFIYKFLYDIGIVPTDEPYKKRRSHGIVLGPDGRKMSKSAGNVINPDEIVEKYGADTIRLYEMFIGPFDHTVSWSYESLEGCSRFLGRLWRAFNEKISGETSDTLSIKLNQTIKKVDNDVEELKFNTIIASFMELLNVWEDEGELSRDDAKQLCSLIAPFAPHLAEEVWVNVLGQEFSVHKAKWPKYDPALVIEQTITIPIQVNGKLRGQIVVEKELASDKEKIVTMAKKDSKVAKWLTEEIKKEIYIEGKLVNFVV